MDAATRVRRGRLPPRTVTEGGVISDTSAKFHVGQIVQHRRFGYRGVVFDLDATFQHSEQWYQHMARSRPPKDQPWYHVLVDGQRHSTYVAERNLEQDATGAPIDHPAVETLFATYADGRYLPQGTVN